MLGDDQVFQSGHPGEQPDVLKVRAMPARRTMRNPSIAIELKNFGVLCMASRPALGR